MNNRATLRDIALAIHKHYNYDADRTIAHMQDARTKGTIPAMADGEFNALMSDIRELLAAQQPR